MMLRKCITRYAVPMLTNTPRMVAPAADLHVMRVRRIATDLRAIDIVSPDGGEALTLPAMPDMKPAISAVIPSPAGPDRSSAPS